MGDGWQVARNGTAEGPISLEGLRQMVRVERLGPTDMVRANSSGPWVSASDISELWRAPESGVSPPITSDHRPPSLPKSSCKWTRRAGRTFLVSGLVSLLLLITVCVMLANDGNESVQTATGIALALSLVTTGISGALLFTLACCRKIHAWWVWFGDESEQKPSQPAERYAGQAATDTGPPHANGHSLLSMSERDPTAWKVPSDVPARPRLWNPTAAANWSIIFTPIFGATLHAANWRALGRPERAAANTNLIGGMVAIILVFNLGRFVPALRFVPEIKNLGSFTPVAVFVMLVGWYFALGRSQIRYVQRAFPDSYDKKSLWSPLLIAAVSLTVYILAIDFLSTAAPDL